MISLLGRSSGVPITILTCYLGVTLDLMECQLLIQVDNDWRAIRPHLARPDSITTDWKDWSCPSARVFIGAMRLAIRLD